MGKKEEATQKVMQLIDEKEKEIVQFAQEYVRHKSINTDLVEEDTTEQVKECQEWLAEQLRAMGIFSKVDIWEVEKNRANVAAVLAGKGSNHENDLMFDGHVDVVPVTDEQAKSWSIGTPWGGEIIDGKIYGRGTSDMKGGNTAFIWATKLIADAGIKLNGNVFLSVVCGEETGQHEIGCDTVLERGYKAPFAVIAEPSDFQIYTVLKGEILFSIKVKGKSTHIANRDKCINPLPAGEEPLGVSAIDKMWKIQQAIMDLEREWAIYEQHPMIPPGGTFININKIIGGSSASSIPGECEVIGSLCYQPGLKGVDVIAQVKTAIDQVVQNDYWLRENPPEVTIPWTTFNKEPVEIDPNHPGVKTLVDSFKAVTKSEPEIVSAPIVCDANFWFQDGQTVVVCGPGSISMGLHGANEYLPIEDLIKACRIYAQMIINWCGVV